MTSIKKGGKGRYHEEDETDAGHDPLAAQRVRERGLGDARHGVRLDGGGLERELGPRPDLLALHVHHVPAVRQLGAVPLPVLEERDRCTNSAVLMR